MTGLDTNVLIGLMTEDDWRFESANRAINLYGRNKWPMAIIPQVIYEFWVVATKPVAKNIIGENKGGLGMEASEAREAIDHFFEIANVIDDGPQIFDIWEQLVLTYNVQGKPAHDARIAAALICSDCTSILTYNEKDFKRYAASEGIDVIDPRTVS